MEKKSNKKEVKLKDEIKNDEELQGSLVSIVSLLAGMILISVVVIVLRNKFLSGELTPNPKLPQTEGVEVVPTMIDKISADSSWCPTFELVWQDMIDVVAGENAKIYFDPSIEIAENLNKREFKESDISDSYYYKVYGRKTLELKETIEKNIKEKFNQTSDILDKFDWSDKALDDGQESNGLRLFFYTMLYREFEYPYVFDKLDNGSFGKYNDVKYFGIDKNSDSKLKNNVSVLFYDDKDNFAIVLNTKDNDQVILYKNPKGDNFETIYNTLVEKSDNYTGFSRLQEDETVKIPYLKFNVLREYDEFANKSFYDENGSELGEIYKAMQTIQFELTEKGGKVKSEAAIDMRANSAFIEPQEIRIFDVDDTFALFIKEKDKKLPYLALRVEDITKFQS